MNDIPAATVSAPANERLDVLDGWRGLSILFVLATHLMPLGPKSWRLNETSGPVGMALFFTLSGFLITGFLLKHKSVLDFLIRRFFRIVPLAWLFSLVALAYVGADASRYFAHFLFYANLPPFWLTKVTSHFWSLCVEVQFYVGVAVLVRCLGSRGLLLLVPLCLAVTGYRVWWGAEISIVTWFRIDEILAGCILALVHYGRLGTAPQTALRKLNSYVLIVLLLISCHPDSGFMNYLRPYLAAALVGTTLVNQGAWLSRQLTARPLKYIAEVSFALYVIHPLVAATWLGSGEGWAKYIKRPLLFGAVFALAHLSTFQFERRCIALGKRLSMALRRRERLA